MLIIQFKINLLYKTDVKTQTMSLLKIKLIYSKIKVNNTKLVLLTAKF